MATTFPQAVSSESWISLFLIENHYFFEVHFTFLDHFYVKLLIMITFWSILAVFEGFGKIKKSTV